MSSPPPADDAPPPPPPPPPPHGFKTVPRELLVNKASHDKAQAHNRHGGSDQGGQASSPPPPPPPPTHGFKTVPRELLIGKASHDKAQAHDRHGGGSDQASSPPAPPPHGFKTVPRELLVGKASHDKAQAHNRHGDQASSPPAPPPPPTHGFKTVPRELLVDKASHDKAQAHNRHGGGCDQASSPPAPPTRGFKTVPRELLVEKAGHDKALAHAHHSSHADGLTSLSPLQRALEEASNDETGIGSLSPESQQSKGVSLNLESLLACEKIYKGVMVAYPCGVGKELSKKEREETKRSHANLVYGEIQFRSMAFILEKIRQEYGVPRTLPADKEGEEGFVYEGLMQVPGKDVLFDIGSGTGKPCCAAAAVFPFKKVVGIEILESLHATALDIQKKWTAEAVSALQAVRGGGKEEETVLEFVQGDFTNLALCDWPREADICVCNSTCFDDALMEKLAALAAGMKQGSFFVTLTKKLPSSDWKVLDETLYMMSWGGATVVTQQKMTPPR